MMTPAIYLAVLLAACVGSAIAQAEAAPDDAVQLDDIVVTAQKQPEPLAGVPISISVLGGEMLDSAAIDSVDDAARRLGNTHVSVDGPLSPVIYVRGIGTTAEVHGFEQSVGTFVDGVYYGRAQFLAAALLDPDTIELIRGPQGTLLGKNTIGGAFNVNTRFADTIADGNAEAQWASRDQRRYRGRFSVPLGDTLGLRLAVLDDNRDGHLSNTTQPEATAARRQSAWRAKLALQPQPRWSAWLSAQGTQHRGHGDGFQLTAATPDSMAYYRQFDPNTEADKNDGHTATDRPGQGNATRSEAVALNVSYAFDAGTLTLLSGAARSFLDAHVDADFSPASLIVFDGVEHYDQQSLEVRWSGRWNDLQGIVGVYALDSGLDIDFDLMVFPGSATEDASRKDFRQSGLARAAFGQLDWDFAPRWRGTAGLRYTRENKRVFMRNAFDRDGAVFMQVLGEEAYETQRARAEEDYSPRLALQFEALDDLRLYAAYAHGFKGGGFNDVAARADVLEFEEERCSSVESGVKATLLDRTLGLNLNLFRTRYRDLQVAAFNGTFYTIQNAASASIDGVELDLRWRVGAGLQLATSLGHLRARYTSFPNAPAKAQAGAPPGTAPTTQDLAGQPLVHAPRWSGGLGAEYVLPFDGPFRVSAGADFTYRDAAFLDLDNDPLDRQPATTLLNAHLGFREFQGGTSLTLFVRNLTDELVQLSGGDVPLFAGNHFGSVEPGRTLGLIVSLAW